MLVTYHVKVKRWYFNRRKWECKLAKLCATHMEGRPSAHKAWTVKLANDYLKRLVKDRAEMDDDEYDEDDSEEQTYEVNMILHEFRDLRARSVKRFRR